MWESTENSESDTSDKFQIFLLMKEHRAIRNCMCQTNTAVIEKLLIMQFDLEAHFNLLLHEQTILGSSFYRWPLPAFKFKISILHFPRWAALTPKISLPAIRWHPKHSNASVETNIRIVLARKSFTGRHSAFPNTCTCNSVCSCHAN